MTGAVAARAARAVVAEDEPLLAAAHVAEQARAWPALEIAAVVGDGASAVTAALEARPDIVFLDIRMPGQDGLQAAEALAEDWPEDGGPLPLLVFVTAYDQYAVQAFERSAIDYVLKPVTAERIDATCRRLEAALAQRTAAPGGDASGLVAQLAALLGARSPAAAAAASVEPLHVLQVGVGNAIAMVPIEDVVLFEAADKYVRVLTAGKEHLIRTSLRELLPRLDPVRFWQVHRGTVVRADAVATAHRDDAGRVTLTLHGRPDKVSVSRLHAARFKAM